MAVKADHEAAQRAARLPVHCRQHPRMAQALAVQRPTQKETCRCPMLRGSLGGIRRRQVGCSVQGIDFDWFDDEHQHRALFCFNGISSIHVRRSRCAMCTDGKLCEVCAREPGSMMQTKDGRPRNTVRTGLHVAADHGSLRRGMTIIVELVHPSDASAGGIRAKVMTGDTEAASRLSHTTPV